MTTIEEIEMSDAEIDEYFGVALAMGNTTGFSKGTANVSPRDLKKLRPLIKFYSKKPHPFRACVKDNRKRFGPLTEKYCAVLKDLIVGNTKWRNQKQTTKKNLSDQTLHELFALDVPDGFGQFLSELTDEEINEMIEITEKPEIDLADLDFAEGDIAWEDDKGFNKLIDGLELALNGVDTSVGYDSSYDTAGYQPPMYAVKFWVKDVYVKGNVALVCEGGDAYYVVGFTQDKSGKVTVDEETDWKPVSKAWVEEKVGLSNDLMAEMFFDTDGSTAVEEDGLIWKPIMREGTWAYSPGGGAAKAKPIKITKGGRSDKNSLTISLEELKSNFESGAIEHVTIPTSHKNTVLENTGFIKQLRIGTDEQGRAVLEAGHMFTEPDVKEKALRGTIANTSAGVLFDYIHKEKGTKFRSVLEHVALTNRPWLNGMKPFGVNASDDLEVIGFSEEPIETAEAEGGKDMPDEKKEFDFSALGFADENELKAALAERATLKAKERERDVTDLCKTWQEDGKTPALVAEAQAIMMADEGNSVLNLSEDGKEVALSASEIVKRLVDKSASVKLTDEPVTDKGASDDDPDDKEVELSAEEKRIAVTLHLDEDYSWNDAVTKAKAEVAAAATK